MDFYEACQFSSEKQKRLYSMVIKLKDIRDAVLENFRQKYCWQAKAKRPSGHKQRLHYILRRPTAAQNFFKKSMPQKLVKSNKSISRTFVKLIF